MCELLPVFSQQQDSLDCLETRDKTPPQKKRSSIYPLLYCVQYINVMINYDRGNIILNNYPNKSVLFLIFCNCSLCNCSGEHLYNREELQRTRFGSKIKERRGKSSSAINSPLINVRVSRRYFCTSQPYIKAIIFCAGSSLILLR